MNYLLDSNVCIEYMRNNGNAWIKHKIRTHSASNIILCSIVVGELLHGAQRSSDPVKQSLAVEAFIQPYHCLEYGINEARKYSEIRSDLESKGLRIGPYDLQIAAIALVHGLTLDTRASASKSSIFLAEPVPNTSRREPL